MDDTIVMRLNRANAAMRDKDRMQDGSYGGNVQDQACLNMWRELVGEFNMWLAVEAQMTLTKFGR